ncbi:uncharacterized protein BYT42DRAFT_556385 [Radiomyces spectabilis]|uniref:uncharacterized protein n=1 Tax=Radiomyces spectabilis TaxID=64574 RepID=UPI00221EFD5B|nr:uncharacterized protein BYT42DRAFT_556385 [Radiomyces spectabilis]KAI8391298.1 hypothetical protein BYT42DRAFT_556385 [Radiomyces spectabilis]
MCINHAIPMIAIFLHGYQPWLLRWGAFSIRVSTVSLVLRDHVMPFLGSTLL